MAVSLLGGEVKIEMTVTGDRKLNRKLKKLTGKEQKKVVKKAAKAALKPVLKETRDKAPKRTGLTRKSIKNKMLPRSRRFIGARITTGGGKGWAPFMEFGTKPRFHKNTGKAVGKIEPRKFMKRAADAKRKHAMMIYKTQIRLWIERVAKGG